MPDTLAIIISVLYLFEPEEVGSGNIRDMGRGYVAAVWTDVITLETNLDKRLT